MDDLLPASPYYVDRETSRVAWESVQRSGWATEAMKLVYQVLYDEGPLTLRELDGQASARAGVAPRGRSESTFVRRVYDLIPNGLVAMIGTRTCGVTGKRATAYAVTADLAPAERRRVETKDDLRSRIRDLEAENARLRAIVPYRTTPAGRRRR